MQTNFQRGFSFVDIIELPKKPRSYALTEIRGPYYEAFTVEQLESLLKTWGYYIDGFKFAGGSQALLDNRTIKKFIQVAHKYNVYVNTGGFIERVIIQDPKNIKAYLKETKELGFDVIEVSNGMFEHTNDFAIKDRIEIIKYIKTIGLKPKPEITIMSGAGGGAKEIGYGSNLTEIKTIDALIDEAEQLLAAGAEMLMVESEGITEGIPNPKDWRKNVISVLIKHFGYEKLMFEISPEDDEARKTFKWYLKEITPNVNLMMNAKNIVEFNAWRLNLWGDKSLWKNKKIVGMPKLFGIKP